MALGELNCPSLEYVYNMTWSEFLIRLYAYRRMEKQKLFMLRELAWSSITAPHIQYKDLPKTKEAFMPISGTVENKRQKERRELMREKMKQARDQYLKELELKNG